MTLPYHIPIDDKIILLSMERQLSELETLLEETHYPPYRNAIKELEAKYHSFLFYLDQTYNTNGDNTDA